jgi:DNA-binding response OmpR family regulator
MSYSDNTPMGIPASQILLLEDDPGMSESTRRILQVGGYEAVICKNICEARKFFYETPPRLMILDGNLPDGNGIDFCREARESGYEPPILMHTGLSSEDYIKAGFDAGCTDYLVKPCDVRLLLSKVRLYLDKYEERAPFAREESMP